MDENSAQIVKRYLKEYYFRFGERIKSPSRIESREFGYLPFGGAMVRHLSFRDVGELRATLVREAPAGVYCSNSFYRDPSLEMHLKGWLGAELIFDIDADTLNQPCKKVHDVWLCKGCGRKEFGLRPAVCPTCKSNRVLELPWACKSCVEASKKETTKLLDFLEFDFGVLPSQTKVYFSGNAGYHVCIAGSNAYEKLDQQGRAEIADYLAGRGVTPALFNSPRLSPTDPGWRGRIARFIRDLPEGDSLFRESGALYEKRLGELLNVFSKKEVEIFLNRALEQGALTIDPMVTTDIHRIFRMPETLNNKTGLVKRECRVALPDFDPLREAVALEDDSNKACVFVDLAPKIELGGNSYGPFRSETAEVPMFVGVYLVLKGAARFVTPDGTSKINQPAMVVATSFGKKGENPEEEKKNAEVGEVGSKPE